MHAQALGRSLERDAGARAGLVEQVHQHAPGAGVFEGSDVAGNGESQLEQLLELFRAAVSNVGEVIEWFSHALIVTSFQE